MDDSTLGSQEGFKWLRGALRGEMARQKVSYAELVERLKQIGVDDNEANLRNKISRGRFSALFFIQALEALGVESLSISLLKDLGLEERKPKPSYGRSKFHADTNDALYEMIEEEVEDILPEDGRE